MSRRIYAHGPWRRLFSTLLVVAFTLSLSGMVFAAPQGSAERQEVPVATTPAVAEEGAPDGSAGSPADPAGVPQAEPPPGPGEGAEGASPAPATGGREVLRRRSDGSAVTGREKAAAREQRRPASPGLSSSTRGASRLTALAARSEFPAPIQVPAPNGCGEMTVATIWAGQSHDAGTVSVWNDADNIYVRYSLTGDWTMSESHLYVGTADPGDLAPGLFPDKAEHSPAVTSYLYTIPRPAGWTAGTALYVAAHSVVSKPGEGSETGWAGQGEWPRLKFRFWIQECPEYEIEVVKFDDRNGDATKEAGEPVMGAGWRFRVTGGPAGSPVDVTQATGADGKTLFGNLAAGNYLLTEVGPYPVADYYPTTPQPVEIVLPCGGVAAAGLSAQCVPGSARVYFGNQERLPGISIEKTVDFDGDGEFGDAELYYAGHEAVWKLVVENTGAVELTGVTVEDSNGRSYGPFSLSAGGSWTTTYATTPDRAVRNVAEAVGYGPRENRVSDSDDASVDTIAPGISIEKTVDFNGDGAFNDSETWYAGSNASWKLVVSNTGDADLSMVMVSDSNGRGFGPFTLPSGESTTFVYVTGPMDVDTENRAAAMGYDPLGRSFSDDDLADIDVVAPGILIDKTVDFDGDGEFSDAETWYVGATAVWKLVVRNTGDTDLWGVTIEDTNGRSYGPFDLGPGESEVVTYTTSPAGGTLNTADATGYDMFERPVFDSDDASVETIDPGISIEKTVDFDGDGSFNDFETWYAGSNASWKLVVSNTGDDDLSLVTVSDSNGRGFGPFPLASGEATTFVYVTGPMGEATENLASVIAVDRFGRESSDEDEASIDVVFPDMSVEKTVDFDGDGVFNDSETWYAGATAVWKIVIANTGDAPLWGVTGEDTNGESYGPFDLGPDESEVVTYSATITEPVLNVVTVTALDPFEQSIIKEADASVEPIDPDIAIEKTVDFDGDGEFSDAEEGIEGDPATWRIVVSNTGDTTLYNIEISDSNGRTFSIGMLDPGEDTGPLQYVTNPTEDTVNVATAVAIDTLENEVGPVEDDAEVTMEPFSPLGFPDIGVMKRADKTVADPGGRVVYTITYTNVSTTTAEDITITDDYDQRYAEVVDASGGAVSGGKIVWLDPVPLYPGDSRSITYTMRIAASMPDGTTNVDNVVVVRTPDDTDDSNNTDDWRVRVGEPFLPFTGAEGALVALLAAALFLIGLTVRRFGRQT